MGKINLGRVVTGGLLAGLVLNVFDYVLHGVILMDDWNAAMAALGKEPMGDAMIAWFVAWDFIMGIFLVWLYAAIRPRFGAGAKTAVYAGLILWFGVGLMVALSEAPLGLFPMNLYTVSTIAALVYVPLASVAGAWVYKEEA